MTIFEKVITISILAFMGVNVYHSKLVLDEVIKASKQQTEILTNKHDENTNQLMNHIEKHSIYKVDYSVPCWAGMSC